MRFGRAGFILLLVLGALAGLSQACGRATFIVQQYDGPVRARDTVAVIRLNGNESVVLDSLDGEDARVRVPEDARLHVEILPGKHTIGVVGGFDTSQPAQVLVFSAEPGKFYRPVITQETRANYYGTNFDGARIYEVDATTDALIKDVTFREPPPAPPVVEPKPIEKPAAMPVADAGSPVDATPPSAADAGSAVDAAGSTPH